MMTTLGVLALVLPALGVGRPAQESSETVQQLIETAKGLLPAYQGEHRSLLRAEDRRRVAAASYLFSAALELQPQQAHVLWWKAHADFLLAENALHREGSYAASPYLDSAHLALNQSLAIDADSYWAYYARGMVQLRQGWPDRALEDYRAAIALIDRLSTENRLGSQQQDAAFVQYKCRSWIPEALLAKESYDGARTAFREFFGHYGDNAWDLGFALLETHLQERQYTAALQHLEELLRTKDYADFPQIYESCAYIQGAVGQSRMALENLERCLERERDPSIYPRLWMLILQEGEPPGQIVAELAGFVANPPRSASTWDLAVGRLLLGGLQPADFESVLREERTRRLGAAEAVDSLDSEGMFYLGYALESRGQIHKALRAYEQAMDSVPQRFNWEWEYARIRYAHLTKQENLTLTGDGPPSIRGTKRFHRAGMAQSLAEVPAQWEPGDLILYRHLEGDERMRRARVVARASLPRD